MKYYQILLVNKIFIEAIAKYLNRNNSPDQFGSSTDMDHTEKSGPYLKVELYSSLVEMTKNLICPFGRQDRNGLRFELFC